MQHVTIPDMKYMPVGQVHVRAVPWEYLSTGDRILHHINHHKMPLASYLLRAPPSGIAPWACKPDGAYKNAGTCVKRLLGAQTKSHGARRGGIQLLAAQGASVQTLCDFVAWRSPKSAGEYSSATAAQFLQLFDGVVKDETGGTSSIPPIAASELCGLDTLLHSSTPNSGVLHAAPHTTPKVVRLMEQAQPGLAILPPPRVRITLASNRQMKNIHSQSEVEYGSTSENMQSQTHVAHNLGVPADTASLASRLLMQQVFAATNTVQPHSNLAPGVELTHRQAMPMGQTRMPMQVSPASPGPPDLIPVSTPPTPAQSAPAHIAADRVSNAQTQHVSFLGFELGGLTGTTAQLQIADDLTTSPPMPGI